MSKSLSKPISLFLIITLFGIFFPAQAQASDSLHTALLEHKQHLLFKPQLPESNVSQNETDALYYEIHIKIDYQTPTLQGLVIARFRSLASELQKIWIDLEQNMSLDSVGLAAISAVHNQNIIEMDLDRAYQQGEEFSVAIYYSGVPVNGGFGYFQFDQMPDGSPHVWTLSEPYGAKYWWPCKDTPGDKADSADIYITIPDDQLAGSNGSLISASDNGDGTKTFHWQERYPIATYLISLATGNYEHFQEFYHYSETDSMLLDYYVYPGELENAKIAFADMHDYLDALSYYFGPYPFLDEKYGMARYNRSGGMEHQTLTSIGRVGTNWVWLYVHELGHQWFGDALTCASWTDIWLNEGFASYAEALYAEWAGYNGKPPGFEAYQDYMFSQYYTNERSIFVADTSEVRDVFNRIVYDKASWVLHMLRHVLGDDVFFEVLKSYLNDMRWQYGSVTTEDFRTVCEEKSGKDLSAFFEQWIYQPGFPKYKYSWTSSSSPGGKLYLMLEISQEQTGTLYSMPIDVEVLLLGGTDTTLVIQNDSWQQSYLLEMPADPQHVELDPQHWIFGDMILDNSQIVSEGLEFKKIYPNPFAEQVTIQLLNSYRRYVDLQIYNSRGQLVRTLSTAELRPFYYDYSWDGTNDRGIRLGTGIYFIRPAAKINNKQPVAKVLLLK